MEQPRRCGEWLRADSGQHEKGKDAVLTGVVEKHSHTENVSAREGVSLWMNVPTPGGDADRDCVTRNGHGGFRNEVVCAVSLDGATVFRGSRRDETAPKGVPEWALPTGNLKGSQGFVRAQNMPSEA